MDWMWVAGMWVALAVGVTLVVARSVRLADRRASEPPARNHVVDRDPPGAPPAPLPPLHEPRRSPEAAGGLSAPADRVPADGRARRGRTRVGDGPAR
jgi:hypothetical protein